MKSYYVVYDQSILDQALTWKNKAALVHLPGINELNKIWIFQYIYETNHKVVQTEYYMYITDNDGKNYIKQFVDRNTFDLDRYDETKKETLINKIGSDNWYSVPPSVLMQ
ncbi:hypothetical protein D3C73_1392220 [compost metagenome]